MTLGSKINHIIFNHFSRCIAHKDECSKFRNRNKGGAMRAGYLSQTGQSYWDNASTGLYSIGLGYDAKANTRKVGRYKL